jgi:vacuolar-type H+-ATPase subunit H
MREKMVERHSSENPEILKQIQEAEVKVGQMNLQAMVEAKKILQRAREQAEQLLQDRRQQMEQISTASLQEGVKAAEQETSVIVEKARLQAREIQGLAMAKMEEAVQLVLGQVFPGLKPMAKK